MQDESFTIEAMALPPFHKNGYILGCHATRQAAYIDPGDEAEELLRWSDANGFSLSSILLTHAHMDHICGVGAVRSKGPYPIYLHREDAPLYEALERQGRAFGFEYPPAPPWDHELREGQDVHVGDLTLQVYHTPGHSPGSVSLVLGRHVFCGDVVFAGSIGRTDLPGGSYETLIESIRSKIIPLGDEKILHSGHGPDTTVGRERQSNPFLKDL